MKDLLSILQTFQSGIFAILGGVVTLIVTHILKGIGKITYLVKDQRLIFNKTGADGFTVSTDLSEAKDGHLEFKIELFNSSEIPKAIRDIIIYCRSNNGDKLFELKPKDAKTRRPVAASFEMDDLELINIPPKKLIQISIYSPIESERIGDMYHGNIMVFRYSDIKGNKKELNILEV